MTASDNDATQGGAFFTYYGTVTMDDGMFTGNDASDRGGGWYFYSTTGTISDTTFEANEASDYAGFYSAGATATFDGCTFTDNVGGNGGGIGANYGTVTVTDSDFDGNSSYDVFNVRTGTGYDYGPSASFTCDTSGCR